MSSIVAVKGSQGFVVSTDSIVIKHLVGDDGEVTGKITGLTRKMFEVRDGLVVVGLGNWNSYFPLLNGLAKVAPPEATLLEELRSRGAALTDARLYVFRRSDSGAVSDVIENESVTVNTSGTVMYPEAVLNSLFLTMYESEAGLRIRRSGMLGMAALIHAFNRFAESLTSDISSPFDTILFSQHGVFSFRGGVTKLPVADFN